MSNFKASGFILKIKKINEKNILYTIFTEEYGKILCSKSYSQKEKSLDMGYNIQFEISVKEGVNIHKIKNIKILQEYNSVGGDFKTLNSFLELFALVHNQLPENLAHVEIYSTLSALLEYQKTLPELFSSQKILLITLKITSLLGNMQGESTDPTIQKILNFVQKNKASEILKLTGLSPEIEEKIKEIILV